MVVAPSYQQPTPNSVSRFEELANKTHLSPQAVVWLVQRLYFYIYIYIKAYFVLYIINDVVCITKRPQVILRKIK